MLAAFLLAYATTYWAVLDGQITGHRMPTIVPSPTSTSGRQCC